MKKFMVLIMASILLIPSFIFGNSKVNAEEEVAKDYPTAQEIDAMNKALDQMIVEANQRLEDGETSFTIKETVGDESIELGFGSMNVPSFTNTKSLDYNAQTLASTQKKVYSAYVHNTAGFNFTHILAGEFVYGGGKLHGASTDVDLSGTMYSESHKTWIDKLDSSVWVVNSNGTFKALKYLMEYNTYITVRLLGSGDYRIERAQLSA